MKLFALFQSEDRFRHVSSDKSLHFNRVLTDLDDQSVSHPEPLFEEKTRSAAKSAAMPKNADSVAQDVCLFHVVGCEEDDAVLLLEAEDVPEFAAGGGVHA